MERTYFKMQFAGLKDSNGHLMFSENQWAAMDALKTLGYRVCEDWECFDLNGVHVYGKTFFMTLERGLTPCQTFEKRWYELKELDELGYFEGHNPMIIWCFITQYSEEAQQVRYKGETPYERFMRVAQEATKI